VPARGAIGVDAAPVRGARLAAVSTPSDPSLSPPDAIVALRSLPRRFRAAAAPRPGRDPHGVEAAAGAAAGAITELSRQLGRVLVEESPTLPDSPADSPAAGPGDPATALDRLAAAAGALADLAAAQAAAAWTRTGRRGGVEVSAAELLREAVHAGVHQLRLVSTGTDDEDDAWT
jgi:hypothetical protein